jgi:hypothetical protein
MRPLHLRKIGYRGSDLLYFGLIYVLMGVAVWINPQPNPILLHTQLAIWFRVTIWSGAGLISVVAAFTWRRWPRTSQIGFAALVFGPAERCISYVAAMIRQPTLIWMAAALLYLLLTLIIVSLSSRPEPAVP